MESLFDNIFLLESIAFTWKPYLDMLFGVESETLVGCSSNKFEVPWGNGKGVERRQPTGCCVGRGRDLRVGSRPLQDSEDVETTHGSGGECYSFSKPP